MASRRMQETNLERGALVDEFAHNVVDAAQRGRPAERTDGLKHSPTPLLSRSAHQRCRLGSLLVPECREAIPR